MLFRGIAERTHGRSAHQPAADRVGIDSLHHASLERMAAMAVEKKVDQDTQEPCPQIGPGFEAVVIAVGSENRILHEVFGILRFARQPKRCRVKGIEVRQDICFELLARLLRFVRAGLLGFATEKKRSSHGL